MRKTTGRPKVLPDDMVPVQTTVPREINAAINALVQMTGTSKTTVLRDALYAGLALRTGMPIPSLPATKQSNPPKKEN